MGEIKKAYDVTYYQRFEKEYNGKKGRAVKVGRAYLDEEYGSINVFMDSMPLNFDGKLRLYPQKDRNETAQPSVDEI